MIKEEAFLKTLRLLVPGLILLLPLYAAGELKVLSANGMAQIFENGYSGWKRCRSGYLVEDGAIIRTDFASSLVLSNEQGFSLRALESTVFSVKEGKGDNPLIELKNGKMLFFKAESIKLRTPQADIILNAEAAALSYVSDKDSIRLDVFEGRAGIKMRNENNPNELELLSGQSVTVIKQFLPNKTELINKEESDIYWGKKKLELKNKKPIFIDRELRW